MLLNAGLFHDRPLRVECSRRLILVSLALLPWGQKCPPYARLVPMLFDSRSGQHFVLREKHLALRISDCLMGLIPARSTIIDSDHELCV